MRKKGRGRERRRIQICMINMLRKRSIGWIKKRKHSIKNRKQVYLLRKREGRKTRTFFLPLLVVLLVKKMIKKKKKRKIL